MKTGRRHSQAPQSRMRRVISNIEIASALDCLGGVNFILVESRRGAIVMWAGQRRIATAERWRLPNGGQDRASGEQW